MGWQPSPRYHEHMARVRTLLVALVCGLALAACSTAHNASARPSSSTVVLSCSGAPLREPKLLILSCRSSGALMAETSWTSWGPSHAVGVGSLGLTPCQPICKVASMNFLSGATIVLEHPRRGASGTDAFSEAIVTASVNGRSRTYRFALPGPAREASSVPSR